MFTFSYRGSEFGDLSLLQVEYKTAFLTQIYIDETTCYAYEDFPFVKLDSIFSRWNRLQSFRWVFMPGGLFLRGFYVRALMNRTDLQNSENKEKASHDLIRCWVISGHLQWSSGTISRRATLCGSNCGHSSSICSAVSASAPHTHPLSRARPRE